MALVRPQVTSSEVMGAQSFLPARATGAKVPGAEERSPVRKRFRTVFVSRLDFSRLSAPLAVNVDRLHFFDEETEQQV